MNFASSSPMPFVNCIQAARERIVARTDEDRTDLLRRRGFPKAEIGKIIETVLAEEGRPPESIFDFVQGITVVARDKPHQDEAAHGLHRVAGSHPPRTGLGADPQ